MFRGPKLVRPEDARPAGPPDKCFYCNPPRPIGEAHDDQCVIPDQTVVVDVTVRLVLRVPATFSSDEQEFFWNDGSNCLDNQWCDILAWAAARDEENSCMCNVMNIKHVRCATEDDEREMQYRGDPQ